MVSQAAHPDANIIFGAVIDDALGDEVRVTVIAAGFDGGAPARAPPAAPERGSVCSPRRSPVAALRLQPAGVAPAGNGYPTAVPSGNALRHWQLAYRGPQSPDGSARPRRTIVFEDDELDVPDFLK